MTTAIETTDIIELPDKRRVKATLKGYNDNSVNAFEETSLEIEWLDGEPLTADEYNLRIGNSYFLHEWVTEQLCNGGKWEPSSFEPL